MDKGKQIIENKYDSGIKRTISFWKNKSIVEKFDELIDIEQQFEKFKADGLKKFKGYQFYKIKPFSNEKIYKHACERKESGTDEEQQVTFNVLEESSKNEILGKGFQYIHLGAIMVAVKGLHRANLGTKTLIVLYDERHTDLGQSILGTFEIDMNTNNGAIIYFCPDFLIDPKEFTKYIKIGIKTKGYKLQEGVKNLLIRVGFIGKLCSTSRIHFKLNAEEMGNMLISKGIKTLPAIKYEAENNTGLEWKVDTFIKKIIYATC